MRPRRLGFHTNSRMCGPTLLTRDRVEIRSHGGHAVARHVPFTIEPTLTILTLGVVAVRSAKRTTSCGVVRSPSRCKKPRPLHVVVPVGSSLFLRRSPTRVTVSSRGGLVTRRGPQRMLSAISDYGTSISRSMENTDLLVRLAPTRLCRMPPQSYSYCSVTPRVAAQTL